MSGPGSFASSWSLLDDQDQVLGEEVDAGQLRGVDRPREDGQVELALDQLWLDDRVRAFDDVQGDVWIRGLERFEEQRDDPASGRSDHAEYDLTVDLGVQLRDVRGDAAQFVEDPSGAVDDDVARLGEQARRAIHQFGAELGLEVGDAVRDIGLHGAEHFGGAREGTVVGDADEGLELSYLHISSIQIGDIYSMLLRDTLPNAILVSARFTYPPNVNALVLQKAQPPPGWSFCVL